jgi:predicted amidohydrolase
MRKMRVAAVQFNHKAADKEFNLKKIKEFVGYAAGKNVELIVFPEMCISGYWQLRHFSKPQLESLAEAIPAGASVQEIMAVSEQYNITVGAGLLESTAEGKLYNAYVVAMPNGEIVLHRKLHCFLSEHMSSGSSYTVFDLPRGVKAGILICYDNNIIENVRITALAGAEILLAPHQTGGCTTPSPRCMGKIDPRLWRNRESDPQAIEAEFRGPKGREWLMHWLPSRAHDNGLFLIFSNGVGPDDDEVRTGNSMIIDPYGDILAETWKAGDEIVLSDIDLSVRDKCTGQRWIASRRPDLYGSLSEMTGNEQDTRKVRFSFGKEDSGQNFAATPGPER